MRRVDDWVFDRVGPIRILFVVQNIFGFAVQEPVIRRLAQNPKIRISIILYSESCLGTAMDDNIKDILEKYQIPRGTEEFRKWHFVFKTDLSPIYFRRNAVVVMQSHGCGFGNLDSGRFPDAPGSDYLALMLSDPSVGISFLNSQAAFHFVSSHVPDLWTSGRNLPFITGLSKLDRLATSGKDCGEKFLKELGLSPHQQTIVLSSHWTEKSLLECLGVKTIDALIDANPDANIIVTGHNRLWVDFNARKTVRRQASPLRSDIEARLARFANLRFCPELSDMVPLLRCADLFVADNSSFLVECCIADRPILFFDNPAFIFSNEVVGNMYRSASISFSDATQLSGLSRMALSTTDELQSQRKTVVDYFVTRLGNSTEYIANIIESMGRQSGPGSKNWNKAIALSQRHLDDLLKN